MNQFEELFKQFRSLESSGFLIQLAQFFMWSLFILFVTWLIRKGLNKFIIESNSRYKVKTILKYLSYAAIFLLGLITFTGKVEYFTIAIGLISAGLAFALQEVILSVAGWVSIMSTKMYSVGDRSEINNVKGDVIDIGITRTTLMEIGEWMKSDNYSGRIVQVSNGYVFKSNVSNYSADFPFLWDEVILPIRFGSDIELTNTIIIDAANAVLTEYADFAEKNWSQLVGKYLIENANVKPNTAFRLTDNWIEFNLRYVVDYKQRRSTKTELFNHIIKAIEATNGKVSLASATYELVGMPDLHVELKDKKDDKS